MNPIDSSNDNLKSEELEGLVDFVMDKSGAAYTIQYTLSYIVTLYSKDKRTIIIKRFETQEKAKRWAKENMRQVIK